MRVAALDAHPHRWEHVIGSILGAALFFVWLGWRLARP